MYLAAYNIFTDNFIYIYFFYGLSFFSLGIVVYLSTMRPTKLVLSKSLRWLALFGILHGFHEWMEMFSIISPKLLSNNFFLLSTSILLTASVFSLLIFGIKLLFYLTNKKIYLYIIYILLIVWVLNILFLIPTHTLKEIILHADILARYFFYFPGSFLSGYALIIQYKILKKQRFGNIGIYFLISGIVFILNSILAGLIVNPSSFFPSNIINVNTFLITFNFPVQLLRGISALLIAFLLIKALDIFNYEEEKYLKESRVKEKSALGKSKKLARQYNSLYQKQKNIAADLQESLLPVKIPALKNYQIGIHYSSATSEALIGGDFYYFVEGSEGLMHIIIGDISGKGIKAASETGNIKNLFNYLTLTENNPAKIMSLINEALYRQYRASKLITCIIISYDMKNSVINIVNAGHPQPIVFNENNVRLINESGIALAVTKNADYSIVQLSVEEADLVVFYTDGLEEARIDNELFGEQRIIEAVSKYREHTPQEIADNLIKEALKFSKNILHDDVLILVMKKT